MRFLTDGRLFRFLLGAMLCFPALLMPYRVRLVYNRLLSFIFHTPYVLFGILARYLLQRLSLYPAGNNDQHKNRH